MYSRLNKTWVIILVLVLILASSFTFIVVGGRNREDPGRVMRKIERRYGEEGNFYIDNDCEFHISDGVLYAAAKNVEKGYGVPGYVFALDLESDEIIWNHSHHGPPKRSVRILSIFVSNGTVYSGDVHGNVVASDAETGEKLWGNSLHEGDYTTRINSLYVYDGMVFTASGNKTVAATDGETGEKIWMHRYHDQSVFSVHAKDKTVYSASGDGNVTAVSAKNGERIWTHQLHDSGVHSLYVQDGVVYSGDRNGKLIAYNPEKEEKIWAHTYHGGIPSHDDSILSIHVDNRVVYSGSSDVTVVAASSENGEKLWRHRYHDANYGFSFEGVSSIQSVDGELYSLHNAGYLISVEKEGSLTLGVLRVLTSFWLIIEQNYGWIILFIVLVGAGIGLIIGKTGGWTKSISEERKGFN